MLSQPKQEVAMKRGTVFAKNAVPPEKASKTTEPETNRGKRRKIPMQFIEDSTKRSVTGSKRRAGVLKKIRQLNTLTGSSSLFVMITLNGKMYTFASDGGMKRFLDDTVVGAKLRKFLTEEMEEKQKSLLRKENDASDAKLVENENDDDRPEEDEEDEEGDSDDMEQDTDEPVRKPAKAVPAKPKQVVAAAAPVASVRTTKAVPKSKVVTALAAAAAGKPKALATAASVKTPLPQSKGGVAAASVKTSLPQSKVGVAKPMSTQNAKPAKQKQQTSPPPPPPPPPPASSEDSSEVEDSSMDEDGDL
jgi:hypothetical protein